MRRLRRAVLMPAFVVVGGVVGSPAAVVAGSTVPAAGAVSWCVINPITDSGCLPVPCPPKLIPCPLASAPAIGLKL